MKLNLGGGEIPKEGFVNIDFDKRYADVKHDLTKPLPYANDSVDKIYASHIIEHFSRAEWDNIKRDWLRVLKSGGICEIRCPDLLECCKNFVENKDGKRWDWHLLTIYGGQEDYGPGQFHKNGFTLEKLVKDLQSAGFETVEAESKNEELIVKITKL